MSAVSDCHTSTPNSRTLARPVAHGEINRGRDKNEAKNRSCLPVRGAALHRAPPSWTPHSPSHRSHPPQSAKLIPQVRAPAKSHGRLLKAAAPNSWLNQVNFNNAPSPGNSTFVHTAAQRWLYCRAEVVFLISSVEGWSACNAVSRDPHVKSARANYFFF